MKQWRLKFGSFEVAIQVTAASSRSLEATSFGDAPLASTPADATMVQLGCKTDLECEHGYSAGDR